MSADNTVRQKPVQSEKVRPNDSWFFFPMFGLEITDESHDLGAPMFVNCTVVSRRHLETLLAVGGPERAVPYFVSDEPKTVSGFIGVRIAARSAPAEGEMGPEQAKYRDVVAKPFMRAKQISSLLGLSLLVSRDRFVGLADDWHITGRSCTRVVMKDKSWSIDSTATGMPMFSRVDREHCLKISRSELAAILGAAPISWLASVLIPVRRILDRTLQQVIVQAAIRIASSACEPLMGSQVLGGVSALEVLLTERGEGFNAVRRRAEALVGLENATHYGLADILNARHRYVHSGEHLGVDCMGLSWNALLLASLCLLTYCSLARRFRSKSTLLKYLDFVRSGDAVLSVWNKTEQEAFASLVMHARSKLGITCLRYTVPWSRE